MGKAHRAAHHDADGEHHRALFGRGLSGWIFFSHQVGSALGAAIGGWVFDSTGSYGWAFVSAAILAVIAAGLSLLIKEEPVSPRAKPATGIPVPSEA